MSSIRALIVDDHALFRDAMATLLGARGIEVVGQAEGGQEAIEQAKLLNPDLILMDVMMPDLSGIQATRKIRADGSLAKIVMLSMSEDDEDILQALEEGADGYILKTTPGPDFSRLLELIIDGWAALSPEVATKLVKGVRNQGSSSSSKRTRDVAKLSDREVEVMRLVAKGLTNGELATALSVSKSTIKYHVSNVLSKLALRNRTEVTTYAFQNGFLEHSRVDSTFASIPSTEKLPGVPSRDDT